MSHVDSCFFCASLVSSFSLWKGVWWSGCFKKKLLCRQEEVAAQAIRSDDVTTSVLWTWITSNRDYSHVRKFRWRLCAWLVVACMHALRLRLTINNIIISLASLRNVQSHRLSARFRRHVEGVEQSSITSDTSVLSWCHLWCHDGYDRSSTEWHSVVVAGKRDEEHY